PIKSLGNIAKTFNDRNYITVLTYNQDIDGQIINKSGTEIFEKNIVVYYAQNLLNFVKLYLKLYKTADIIYLNSFFSSRTTFPALMLKKTSAKVLLAPRGELTLGALTLKPLKKKIYIKLFNIFANKNEIYFQFTSEEEKKESLISLKKGFSYTVIPNMHDPIPPYIYKHKKEGEIHISFISRISPKKNLKAVLLSLLNIAQGDILLSIAGNIEDEKYWAECMLIINKLPQNVKVNYLGGIKPTQVIDLLKSSHLFFLPTLNENYGHAIVESMINSNVVLISDQTPWSDVQWNGGYVAGYNDTDTFKKCITECMKFDESQFNNKSRQVYDYARNALTKHEYKTSTLFDI
ncbi:glycosyltransferase, partial [Escherichia coli]